MTNTCSAKCDAQDLVPTKAHTSLRTFLTTRQRRNLLPTCAGKQMSQLGSYMATVTT